MPLREMLYLDFTTPIAKKLYYFNLNWINKIFGVFLYRFNLYYWEITFYIFIFFSNILPPLKLFLHFKVKLLIDALLLLILKIFNPFSALRFHCIQNYRSNWKSLDPCQL
jgi:hypothetical protein